jgi:hypothetical protein
LNCGAPKTIQAHLIPKAFVMEVKGGRGEQHLIIHQGASPPKVSNTGVYDKAILCGPCDNVLGRYEKYAHSILGQLRRGQLEPGRVVTVEPLDGDRLVRFAAGIAWKYAVTTKERGRIDIGPYPEILRSVAWGEQPIPDTIDLAMFRIIEFDGDVYFYRTPMPDRQDGVNIVRFAVGSFVFFLKIDRRRPSGVVPADCWLRGRSVGTFLTVPASAFEEGRIHAKLASHPTVRNFFGRMRQRAFTS